MAIFNDFPYTNFHELNLDWLIRKMKELESKYGDGAADLIRELLRTYFLAITYSQPDQMINLSLTDDGAFTPVNTDDTVTSFNVQGSRIWMEHAHATKHVSFYVNGNAGDDAAAGTETAPLRTLNEAIKRMNASTAGAYIYLTAAGQYYLTEPVISGCMIHLQATTGGVSVQWLEDSGDYTKAFYNCYLHLSGPSANEKIRFRIGSVTDKAAKLESGKIYLAHAVLETDPQCDFSVIGGFAQFNDVEFRTTLNVSHSTAVFTGACSFSLPADYAADTRWIHAYNESVIGINAEITLDASNKAPENMLYATRCVVFFAANLAGDVSAITGTRTRLYNCLSNGIQNSINSWLNNGTMGYVSNSTINGAFYHEQTGSIDSGYRDYRPALDTGEPLVAGNWYDIPTWENSIVLDVVLASSDGSNVGYRPIIPYIDTADTEHHVSYTVPKTGEVFALHVSTLTSGKIRITGRGYRAGDGTYTADSSRITVNKVWLSN